MNGSKTDLGTLGATELLRLYRRRDVSPVEATKAAFERIGRFNEAVNAFCLIDEEGALAVARASEERWMRGEPVGTLDGLPTTIKDLTVMAGTAMRRGSKTSDPDDISAVDAPIAARMREAGAVFLGKTTTPEFGWKGVTDSPLTGITRNPWNVSRTSGGSSGGAAAAAALNMGVLHQGSDAGGSIRIPAGFSGVFGHKPTFGFVPQWPTSAMGTLAHVGPITRSVEDAALMLTVVGKPDDRDWLSVPFERDWTVGLNSGVRGLRVAYSRTLGFIDVRPDVLKAVDAAVEALADMGAHVEEVDPGITDSLDTFNVLWFSGAAKIIANMPEEKRGLVDPGLLAVAEEGAGIDAVTYLRAVDDRGALANHMAAFHRDWDLLVTPTLPITAFEVGADVPAGSGLKHWMQWTPFSYPFDLTQQPAATVPVGFGDDGLPVGLHVVADRFRDDLVLRASAAVESALPPVFPNAPQDGA